MNTVELIALAFTHVAAFCIGVFVGMVIYFYTK